MFQTKVLQKSKQTL